MLVAARQPTIIREEHVDRERDVDEPGVGGHMAAEIEFTIVSRAARRSGIGTGLKAVSVLSLIDHGVTTFRASRFSDNDAILRANTTLGFVVDEHRVTLKRR